MGRIKKIDSVGGEKEREINGGDRRKGGDKRWR